MSEPKRIARNLCVCAVALMLGCVGATGKPSSTLGLLAPGENVWPEDTSLTPPEGHAAQLHCLSFSSDGRWLLSGGEDKSLLLWEVESGRLLKRFVGHTGYVDVCAFVSQDQQVVSGGGDGAVLLWDTGSGQLTRKLLEGGPPIYALATPPEGGEILVGTRDGFVRGWKPHSGIETFTSSALEGEVRAVGYTAGGDRFAVIHDKRIVIWTGKGKGALRPLPQPASAAIAVGKKELIVGVRNEVRQVDEVTGKVIHSWGEYAGWVQTLAISPRTQTVLAADSTVTRLWNLDNTPHCQIEKVPRHVRAAAFSPDGGLLALAGAGGGIRLVTAADCQPVRELTVGQSSIMAVAGGQLLGMGDASGLLSVWSGPPWRLESIRGVQASAVHSIDKMPGGGWAVGGSDRVITLVPQQGEVVRLPASHRTRINKIKVLKNGRVLAIDDSGEIWLHDSTSSQSRCLRGCGAKGEPLTALALAPDEQEAVVAGLDKWVLRLALPDGQVASPWPVGGASGAQVTSLVYSLDGRSVVQGNVLGEVVVRDAKTGEVRKALHGLTSKVAGLVFGGGYLWGAEDNGRLVGWRLSGDGVPGGSPSLSFDEGAPIKSIAPTSADSHLIVALGDGRAAVRALPKGTLAAWLVPLRDGSWSVVDLERKRVFYQGDGASRLRIKLANGGVQTLKELAEDPGKLPLSIEPPELVRAPTGEVHMEVSIISPSGQPEVRIDEEAVADGVISRGEENPALWIVEHTFSDVPGTSHEIVVRDREGSERRRSFRSPDEGGFWTPSGRRALVIGQSKYGKITPLPCAVPDVAEMKSLLTDASGWALKKGKIHAVTDLSGQQLREDLVRFLSSAGKDEQLLLYFAGHGQVRNEKGYLLPVDYDPDYPERDLSMDELWKFVNDSNARHVLIIIDACQSSSFADSFAKRSFSSREDARHAVIAAASKVALCDAKGSHFTLRFVESLRKPELGKDYGAVTVRRAFLETMNKLDANKQQAAWSQGLAELPLFFPGKKKLDKPVRRLRGSEAPREMVRVSKPAVKVMQQALMTSNLSGWVLEVKLNVLHRVRDARVRVYKIGDEKSFFEVPLPLDRPLPWDAGEVTIQATLKGKRLFKSGQTYVVKVEIWDEASRYSTAKEQVFKIQ